MSIDIHLLPLQPTDDFDEAMKLLDELHRGELRNPSWDARDAVPTLIQLDGRYRVYEKDYASIAQFEGISEEEARQRHGSVQLNGENANGDALAQVEFNRNHITIHNYPGTTAEELDDCVVALCRHTGLAAVDPQEGAVWRIQEDGTLG